MGHELNRHTHLLFILGFKEKTVKSISIELNINTILHLESVPGPKPFKELSRALESYCAVT